jgi:hypothetical protein
VLAAGIFGYLKVTQPGAGLVDINGAVESPYQFNATDTDIKEETMEVSQGGVSMSYRGYPLQDILQKAQPNPGFDLVLLQASDGYEFFVTKSELEENEGLLLQAQGKDDKLVYNMVGPRTKKAWVNGMVEITLVAPASLEIVVEGQEPRDFQPGAWVQDMDSTNLDVGYGPNKYQGVPLNLALSSEMEDESLSEVVLVADDGEEVTLPVEKVRTDEGVRLFVILEEGSVSYAVAHMNGEFYLTDVKQIRLR